MTKHTEKERNKQVANTLRGMASDVELGRVNWVWIAMNYTEGVTIKYATDKAPKRPGGIQ